MTYLSVLYHYGTLLLTTIQSDLYQSDGLIQRGHIVYMAMFYVRLCLQAVIGIMPAKNLPQIDVGGLWVNKSLESGDGEWLLLDQEIITTVA